MEFPVKKPGPQNLGKYPKAELDLAYEFAKRAYDEFGDIVKAIVLFGSAARNQAKPQGDIDILIIVDDVTIDFTRDIVETYRIITQKLVADISTRLHVTTLRITSFWEYVRAGDPVAINVLRDGIALLDTGFFDPLRALLARGRIRPTNEAIWTYFARAPRTLNNSRWHIMQATLDLYWAVIDSAHAALMSQGETPPSPEHVADMLEEKLVKKKLLGKKEANTMRKFYKLQKDIMYRNVKLITGPEYESYSKDAEAFVKSVEAFINAKK